jgi:hypothetical protein
MSFQQDANIPMKNPTRLIIAWIACVVLFMAGLLCMNGCASSAPAGSNDQPSSQAVNEPAPGQPQFDTDKAAADAVVDAAKNQDHDQVHLLLGPNWKDLISGDKVEDADDFKDFANRAAENMRLERQDDSTTILHVGSDDWAFPIPIVKTSDGKWFLDTNAGKAEVLARRIGRNELEAIQICHLFVDAEHEYASQDRNGSDVIQYAQRILSTPGSNDGLYWKAANDQSPSPLDELIQKAKLEGYSPQPGQHVPYHGYHFRVLKCQGTSAPGGQYDYVINGHMIAGFAIVGFPVEYGNSGIMTFIVNQEGKVYQKDLGPQTTDTARHMIEYNPDSTWTLSTD